MDYIPRHIETVLREYLKIFPAVSLTGPRQSGKSTTLKETLGDEYRYVSFDDPHVIDFLSRDPKGFMKEYDCRVIFDEAQKAPLLFNYLKLAIDQNRHEYGNYVLAGSSQFALVREITETLAGRIGSLSLLPFQIDELPRQWRQDQILKGSYPELVHLKYKKTWAWYAAYVNHYIERDVRSVSNVGNLRDFQRLLQLLAARVSQELNMASLSKEIGVTIKTIQSWISILEASYIVFLVPSYHNNLGKRIVKRPKLYFYDTGLVCYFAGIEEESVLRKGPLDGPVFENYIVAEIKKWIVHHGLSERLFYFRTNLGLEVDLIVEDQSRASLKLIEIKSSHTPKVEMFAGMSKVAEMGSQQAGAGMKGKKFLIYRGETLPGFLKDGQCLNYFDLGNIFVQ